MRFLSSSAALATFGAPISSLQLSWMAHTLGEREMEELILRAVSRGSLRSALWLTWGSAAFFFLVASMLWWLVPDDEIAWYFGAGVAAFALAFVGHSTSCFVRVFRKAREANAA